MNKHGNIRQFDSEEAAKAANFDTILTPIEAAELRQLSPELRHAALRRIRDLNSSRKAKRRENSNVARKARRLQRDR